MGLIYKELGKNKRSMYIYFPEQERRTPFKRCSITVLRDETDEASVWRLLREAGLLQLAEENEAILSFPNAEGGRWNYDFSGQTDDIAAFRKFQDSMDKEDDLPLETGENGIPTYRAMMSTWHPMQDTRYLIGIGSGADMACTLAACAPANIAAVLSIGGRLCQQARYAAVGAAMPICLTDSDVTTCNYFRLVNEIEMERKEGGFVVSRSLRNPQQCVMMKDNEAVLTKTLAQEAWDRLMSRTRRTNTSVYGDIEPRLNLRREGAGFEFFLEDDRLEEKVRTKHTWFTHVPEKIREGQTGPAPLVVFFHGGSDNPEEAAQMSRFHELGEKEGFITVYPWGTDKAQWNMKLLENGADDVGFCVALIRYMTEHYPVDKERVYLSGFSNGAGQAQTVAMLYPELIAGICHIDSNWPGVRFGEGDLTRQDRLLFDMAMKKKECFDYRMPVWYTYGSREISYPVFNKSSQQHQYDFWKRYNNIRVESTPDISCPDPCGSGVQGQLCQRLRPSERHPAHYYDVHRFFSEDAERLNLYNYVVMHDKGHDVAQMDAALGWEYVKQFRRLADGSLEVIQNGQDEMSNIIRE